MSVEPIEFLRTTLARADELTRLLGLFVGRQPEELCLCKRTLSTRRPTAEELDNVLGDLIVAAGYASVRASLLSELAKIEAAASRMAQDELDRLDQQMKGDP